MSLSERILDTAARKTQTDRASLNENTLISELPIDSLAFMDLVMQIEEAEDVVLTDGQVEEILGATKLGEVVNIIDAAKANATIKS